MRGCAAAAQTDMLLLLQSLTFAAHKVGITKFRPNSEELHKLAKEMVLYVLCSTAARGHTAH